MKINIYKKDLVEKEIRLAEGKSKRRKLDVDDVKLAARKAERKLKELGIPKKSWTGSKIIISPDKVPNSYRWRADGTYAILEKYPSGWFMINVYRDRTGRKPYGGSQTISLILSEKSYNSLPNYYIL